MASLVDQIENYIKRLLDLSEDQCVEVRRADLAEIFMCVPSQINYVLEKRFSRASGYYIETRRGGGGYIRIMKLDFEGDADISALLDQTKAKRVTKEAADHLIQRLFAEDLLTKREAVILRSIMDSDTLDLEQEDEEYLRGRMMRWVLIHLLREDLN